jgi:hypothetical protein
MAKHISGALVNKAFVIFTVPQNGLNQILL